MIDTLRKNAAAMAERDDVAGIANSLNDAADEIEKLQAAVAEAACHLSPGGCAAMNKAYKRWPLQVSVSDTLSGDDK